MKTLDQIVTRIKELEKILEGNPLNAVANHEFKDLCIQADNIRFQQMRSNEFKLVYKRP
jgi:CO/xanthine dehydrogenase FAD-binding subunit